MATMPKVTRSRNCGNSPKNDLVQALAVAIETGNRTAFARCIDDDVVWSLPGRRSFDGRDAALACLKSRMGGPDVARVVMRRVVSHGRAGAADGTLVHQSGATTGFCHVVEFSSPRGRRVISICSYYSDIGEAG